MSLLPEEIQKAYQEREYNIYGRLFNKGKALPEGTVRNWKGKLYRKHRANWDFIGYANDQKSNKDKESKDKEVNVDGVNFIETNSDYGKTIDKYSVNLQGISNKQIWQVNDTPQNKIDENIKKLDDMIDFSKRTFGSEGMKRTVQQFENQKKLYEIRKKNPKAIFSSK